MTRKQSLTRWAFWVVVAYSVIGFFIAPPIVRWVLVGQLKEKLHRDASVRKVRLNPYALSVTIDGLQINERNSTNRFVGWEKLYVNLQIASVFQRVIVLREVSLSNAFAHVSLQRDQSLNFSDLIPPPSTNTPSTPPTIRIGKLHIVNAQLVAEDFSRREPFTTTVGPVNVALENFSTRSDNQNPYAFTATTEAGEKFSWRGSFYLNPVRSAGDFVVEQIALPKYSPYLDQFPNLNLRSGRFGVRGTYQVNLATNAMTALLTNAVVTLDDLHLAERDATNDAVIIQNLTVSNLCADALAGRVDIGEISFTGERVAAEMTPGNPPNLLRLFAPPPKTNTAPATSQPPRNFTLHVDQIRSTDGGASLAGIFGRQEMHWQGTLVTNINVQTEPLQVSVTAITVTNGAFLHTDAGVTPPARLSVQQINSAITGFSLGPDSETQFRMTAKVNNVSPVELTGRLTPITLNRADVKVLFQDVSLLPLDPYVGKYLGYRLDSGSLALDLNYAVNNRQLNAGNVITVDQMDLGAATGSPDAIKLPVKLGLAILKDRNGVIKLDVPISGSFDNPQFRLRPVIIQTFKNLFVKILTSPFAALGSMFGGGGDELGYQAFLPGHAELQPSEAKKLDVLLRALTERPGLHLEIQGAFDQTEDTTGLKRVKLDAALTNTTLQALYLANLDKLQATIIVTNPAPADVTGFSNVQGLRPKNAPRVTTSAVPTARSEAAKTPPAEMERQLLEIMAVTDADLEQLADARAAAVRVYLLQPGTLDAARLSAATERKKAGTRAFLNLQ